MPRQHTLLVTLIIILGSVYLILRRREDSPVLAPVPQVPIGTPVYRQRLVAVGDLHGGKHAQVAALRIQTSTMRRRF